MGVIAIGHSGLTGEGSAASASASLQNSWATGTNPEVNSIYQRLVATRPETEGKVANAATGGAPASELASQASRALEIVPTPALVIVSTIDGDIRCDGSDADHVPEFGASVAEALDVIKTASPDSRIVVVGQFGRPRPEFVEELVAHDPSVKAELTGAGICDPYDLSGTLVEKNLGTLTSIIEGYEAEQARVCAEVSGCATDGGARAAYVDELEHFTSDWAHLNAKGQAAQAALMWPVVAELLEL